MAPTPVQPTHPGVYINEVPTAGTIQAASTSIPAFIGVTESGPFMQPVLITSWNAYLSEFGNLAWYAMVSWSVFEFFNEGGSACYVIRVADTVQAEAASGTLPLELTAVTAGTWGNVLNVMVSNTASDSAEFTVSILVEAGVIGESGSPAKLAMPNLLLQQFVVQNNLLTQTFNGKPYYVLEQFTGFTAAGTAHAAGVQSELGKRINSTSIFVRIPLSSSAGAAGRPANGGPSPLTGGKEPNNDFAAATKLLASLQNVSLLSVPDITTATDKNGNSTQAHQATLINAALLYCTNAGNVFYVIDPPAGLGVQDIVQFKTGQGKAPDGNPTALNSAYGALYYPWVTIYAPALNANVPIPPSGPVLGRYASTDTNAGVFKSPAGIADGALSTVVALAQQVSDADQDQMNPNGVNAIRNFINYGNVIFGARTTSMDSDWTYVSVRRLFIYVEQSIKQSLQWVVFEPNNQQLWSAVTRDVSAFLTTLWQQGGLFGSTAAESYFVTCNETNNPPETIAQGLMYMDVGMAPVYPAEFVITRLTFRTAGAN